MLKRHRILLMVLMFCALSFNVSYALESENQKAVECNVNLVYNNKYHERIIKPNEKMSVLTSVTNNSEQARDLICYIAEYDASGKLVKLEVGAEKSVAAGENKIQFDKTFSANTNNAKLFFWDKNSISPFCRSVELNARAQDYYADTFETAQRYDADKNFCGSINTADDIDYIKFKPSESGVFIINIKSDFEIHAALYDEDKNRLQQSSTFENGCYIKADLNKEKVYYLKIYAQTRTEYEVSVKKTDMQCDVTVKNGLIKFSQNGFDEGAYVKLLNSSGEVLNSVYAQSEDGKITAEFALDTISDRYKTAVLKDNFIVGLFDIDILHSTKNPEISIKSYVSVPVVVYNALSLDNVWFSVSFDENDFSLCDACEDTYNTAECGKGVVTVAEIDIKEATDKCVVFTSWKNISQQSENVINTVKLQAKRETTGKIDIYVYRVR